MNFMKESNLLILYIYLLIRVECCYNSKFCLYKLSIGTDSNSFIFTVIITFS